MAPSPHILAWQEAERLAAEATASFSETTRNGLAVTPETIAKLQELQQDASEKLRVMVDDLKAGPL